MQTHAETHTRTHTHAAQSNTQTPPNANLPRHLTLSTPPLTSRLLPRTHPHRHRHRTTVPRLCVQPELGIASHSDTMMRSRSRSPSKSGMAPSASTSRPVSRMSTSRPPSRADGYRNSVAQPRDEAGPSSSRGPESITRAEFWDVVMEDETEESNGEER